MGLSGLNCRVNNKIITLAAPSPPAAHTPVVHVLFLKQQTQFCMHTSKCSFPESMQDKDLAELHESTRRRRLLWSPESSSCPHGLGTLASWPQERPQAPADKLWTLFNKLLWLSVVELLYLEAWIHILGHRQIFQAVAKLFPVSKLAASQVYQIMHDSTNVRHVWL